MMAFLKRLLTNDFLLNLNSSKSKEINNKCRSTVLKISKGRNPLPINLLNNQRSMSTRNNSNDEKKKKQTTQDEVPPSLLSDVTCDLIGPPDPTSNIPPIKCYIPPDETPTEKVFRLNRMEVVEWNQKFWSTHNLKFSKEKELFVKEMKEKKSLKKKTLSAEEMSIFYRNFLNENRQSHLEYNREWYKKNLGLVWPAFKVSFIRLRRRLTGTSGVRT